MWALLLLVRIQSRSRLTFTPFAAIDSDVEIGRGRGPNSGYQVVVDGEKGNRKHDQSVDAADGAVFGSVFTDSFIQFTSIDVHRQLVTCCVPSVPQSPIRSS
jgi:hypothetical protein